MVRKIRHHLDKADGGDDLNLAPRHLTKQEFGRRVYAAILSKGWNQSYTAKRAGLTRDSISNYVRGNAIPTPESLTKLATALGMEPEDLLPNYIEGAIDSDHPSIEIRVSPNQPREAWLRVDRQVSLDTALKITDLLNNDKMGE